MNVLSLGGGEGKKGTTHTCDYFSTSLFKGGFLLFSSQSFFLFQLLLLALLGVDLYWREYLDIFKIVEDRS